MHLAFAVKEMSTVNQEDATPKKKRRKESG